MKTLLLFFLLTVKAESGGENSVGRAGELAGEQAGEQADKAGVFQKLIAHFIKENNRLDARIDSLSNLVEKRIRKYPDGHVTASTASEATATAAATTAALTTTTTTSPTTTITTSSPTTTTKTTSPTTTTTTTSPTTTTTTTTSPTTTTTISSPTTTCPQMSDDAKKDWDYVGPSGESEWIRVGRRFLRFEKHAKNFEWASKHCQSYGGEIAYDDSAEAHEHIKTKNKEVWIGASDVKKDGNFTWTNGTSVGAGKWAPNEPNSKGIENCAEGNWRKSGKWNNDNCITKRLPFFCQVDRIPPRVSGRYMRLFKSGKNYAAAEATCKGKGGELAVVDDANVQQWIDNKQKKAFNAWISATHAVEDGRLMWPNGQPVLIARWKRGQEGKVGCTKVGWYGKWISAACGDRLWVLCQIKC